MQRGRRAAWSAQPGMRISLSGAAAGNGAALSPTSPGPGGLQIKQKLHAQAMLANKDPEALASELVQTKHQLHQLQEHHVGMVATIP